VTDPDPDPYGPASFWEAGSGSGYRTYQSEKQDPDPHQSENVEALECHFGALEGPNLEKE
jgi:hypothetical protein